MLMALSTPSQNKAGKLGGEGREDSDEDADDDDGDEEEEDEDDDEDDDEGAIDGNEVASEGRLERGKAGVETPSGGVGPGRGGGVKGPRVPLAGAGKGQGAGEACDAPES